ncbi:hypothetical protein ACV4VJ_30995, partial [Pseudomonas aeruginosa]
MEPPGWGKHARKFYLWGVCGSGKLTASAGKVLRILAVGGDEGGTIERAGYFLYNFQARVWLAVSSDAV